MKHKVVIAAGGTGGHLFPSQALARELKEKNVDILFAGAKLDTNRYFKQAEFAHATVSSSAIKGITSLFQIFKGIWQSIRVLSRYKPKLVVGFGSFHAFPVLAAAFIKRIPVVLFESNVYPGKVNRYLSRFAKVTTVQFGDAAKYLSGQVLEVELPVTPISTIPTREEARDYYGLDRHRLTLLVTGGSQGAVSVNEQFCQAIKTCKGDIQVIHITGDAARIPAVEACYKEMGIPAAVKSFEDKMRFAWCAADLAVCRSGAATLAELIAYEVPSILIPYPYAADDHQSKNADFLEKNVGGAFHLRDLKRLDVTLQEFLEPPQDRLKEMKECLAAFKKCQTKDKLSSLIEKYL